MTKKKIKLNLNDNSYEIFVGDGIATNSSLIKKFISDREVLIVWDSKIPQNKISQISKSINKCSPFKLNSLKLSLSEKLKNFTSVSKIHNLLIKKNYSRNALVICVGGGILSDVSGFAAATYLRGIDFILMPSTLLSQVDASIGGKTGINHQRGKNLIGSFHQPKLVLADITLLKSLNTIQMSEGFAEIIKHCLIKDKKLFNWLENKISKKRKLNTTDLTYLIYRSIKIKSAIVEKDEKEQNLRALLNFGHTFGHAFETLGKYKKYSHGEAVSLGMIAALNLSKEYYPIPDLEINKVRKLLLQLGLITKPKEKLNLSKFYSAMQTDKKRHNESLRFILLESLGIARVKEDIPKELIIKVLKQSF